MRKFTRLNSFARKPLMSSAGHVKAVSAEAGRKPRLCAGHLSNWAATPSATERCWRVPPLGPLGDDRDGLLV